MKKFLAMLILLAIPALTIFAKGSELSVDDITTEALMDILDKEYSDNALIDEDGDLFIKIDGIGIYIEVDEDRELIKLYTQWGDLEKVSETRLCKLLNKWNSDKIFATAYSYKDLVVLEHYICTTGGINSVNFNETISWIFGIADSFAEYLNEEDVL